MIDVQEPAPLVGVLAASPAELPIMRQAGLILEKFGIPHEIRIMSSSRNPDLVDEYARTAFERGLKVVICSTGISGHLAAAVAARTILPVIGVPIATAPQMVGNEALAITAQMPTGVPGRDGRRRRRGERRDPRRPDRRRSGRRDAGAPLEVQGRPGGGPQALIPRYSLPEMAAVWSDEARLANWLEIEILAVEAWAELGKIPPEDARAVRERAAFTVERVNERERVTQHDVAAFVEVVAASIGPPGRWIHFGLTSSDVLDTGLALQLRDAADLLLGRVETLLGVTKRLALQHRDTVMVGRTHGVHAEPTTFGHKLAVWAFELDRDRERLRRAREAVSVGAISGVVGTYASVDPRVEEEVCAKLGLRPAEASSQVIPRDRHAEYMAALAILASSLDEFATEIRHLARTEVREVQEPFAEGQKGSSAMPHKRNPVRCERITGLARVIRGNAQAALENVALWHERDISHSSAERVIFPDSTIALDFMLADLAEVLEGLRVFPERMRENLDAGGGLAFSQAVLLALVDAGLSRDDAYRIVQEAAAAAWDEGASFRDALEAEPEVAAALTEEPRRAVRPGSVPAQPRRRVRSAGEASGQRGHVSARVAKLHAQGKVRDVYDAGDDRCSSSPPTGSRAFDVVLPDPIPDKGRVLTGLSLYWFDRTKDLVPNHLLSADVRDFPAPFRSEPDLAGRAMLVKTRRGRARRVRGARLPDGLGVEAVSSRGSCLRRPAARRARRVGPPARADLHADDEGGRGPRPAAHARGDRRPGRQRARRAPEGAHAHDLRARRRDRAGARDHPGRHEVRVRVLGRRAHPHRRGPHPRLVAVLAGRRLRARAGAAVVRQAVRARLARRERAGTTSRRRPACPPTWSRGPPPPMPKPTNGSPASRSRTISAAPAWGLRASTGARHVRPRSWSR